MVIHHHQAHDSMELLCALSCPFHTYLLDKFKKKKKKLNGFSSLAMCQLLVKHAGKCSRITKLHYRMMLSSCLELPLDTGQISRF